MFEAALHDHSITVAELGMTGRAVDVEALLAARQNFRGDRERQVVAVVAADPAGIEIGIRVQMSASHGAFDNGPRRALVGIEVAFHQGPLVRLVLHVGAAAGHQQQGDTCQQTGRNLALPEPRGRTGGSRHHLC